MKNIIILFITTLLLAGCNPLVSKTSIDTNFAPGVGTSVAVSPIATNSTMTVSASTLAADGVASATVTVTLSNGSDYLASKIVTLSTNRGAADILSATAVLTDALGVATFTVTSTTSGTAIFSARDSSDGVSIEQTKSISYTAGAADHLQKIDGYSMTANVSAALATNPKVQVVDRYGNGVSGVDLSFISTRGGGVLSSLKVTSDTYGYASTPLRMGAGDTNNTIEVRKLGVTQLPDLAVSGRVAVQLTNTSTTLGNGNFYGDMPASVAGSLLEIAAADLNGDGNLDVVVPQQTPNKVRVLIGNGNGTFQAGVDYAIGSNAPAGITIADVNADSKLDLIVSNWANAKVSVLLGNGNGTFQARQDFTSGTNCYSTAVADFDGDTKPDLAVSCATSNIVSILIGNGNGTFQAKVDTAVANPSHIYSMDLNGDGKLDLIFGNHSTSVNIMLGNGNGTFAAVSQIATTSGADYIAFGDFDGDGKTDMAVTVWFTGKISVHPGNGDGTFGARTDYTIGANPGQIEAKDINGDGKLDLICPNKGSATISTLLGNGNGTFQAKVDILTGDQPYGLVVADIDNDGKHDIVFQSASTNFLGLLKGNGNGTFENFGQNAYTTGTNPADIATADLNADGILDLVVSNAGGGTSVSVFIGNSTAGVANGTFQAKVDYAAVSGAAALRLGDFNEDGAQDIVVANYGTNKVSVFLGNKTAGVANGTFAAKVDYTVGNNPSAISIGDFNQDGHIDLAVANYISETVSLLTGIGDGTFTVTTALSPGGGTLTSSLAVADINADGKHDIAVMANGTGKAIVYLGNGNGTFQAGVQYTPQSGMFSVSMGDFNNDGNIDMLVPNYSSASVSYFAGVGDGTFSAPVHILSGQQPSNIRNFDINGDGNLDIVLTSKYDGLLSVLLGNGNGTFQTRRAIQSDSPSGLVAADFNADGKLDFAVTNTSNANFKIILGK